MVVGIKTAGFEMNVNLDELGKAYKNKIRFTDDDTGKEIVREEISKTKAKRILELIFAESDRDTYNATASYLSENYPKLYALWLEVSR